MGTTNRSIRRDSKNTFNTYMSYNFIPKHANKVYGLVYLGASLLIIVVGLRGLGSLAGKVDVIPSFLLGADGKIDPTWVLAALLVEFSMLLLLSIVTFFSPPDTISEPHKSKTIDNTVDMRDNLRELKEFAEEEMKIVDDYLEKFDNLSKKVINIQATSISAISKMKENIEN